MVQQRHDPKIHADFETRVNAPILTNAQNKIIIDYFPRLPETSCFRILYPAGGGLLKTGGRAIYPDAIAFRNSRIIQNNPNKIILGRDLHPLSAM
jgi:hypothetical protein